MYPQDDYFSLSAVLKESGSFQQNWASVFALCIVLTLA